MDELPRKLSAKYKEDFAYPTVKDRLPVILTKVIDTLHRSKTDVLSTNGEEGVNDLKAIIGSLSKLRNELQTDKILLEITDGRSDVNIWNNYLHADRLYQGEDPRWYLSAWLYTECYFYRRISECIYSSKVLKTVDPFKQQKCNALTVSMPAVVSLAKFLKLCSSQLNSKEQIGRFLKDFMQISLWGNKCDLSISAGVENAQTINIETSLDSLKPYILTDDSEAVERLLLKTNNTAYSRIHFVLDNAGFELFSDLVLMDFLLTSKLATSITLHGKAIPWFVSDVTIDDLQWTLEQLKSSEDVVLQQYGNKWQGFLDSGVVIYKANDFWTSPHDFTEMQTIDKNLYDELCSAKLVIFKGDLNYRKLTGDFKWDYDTAFQDALRGFQPTAVCALRTIKCDLVVGITKEIAKKVESEDSDWLYDAKWAVLNFAV